MRQTVPRNDFMHMLGIRCSPSRKAQLVFSPRMLVNKQLSASFAIACQGYHYDWMTMQENVLVINVLHMINIEYLSSIGDFVS